MIDKIVKIFEILFRRQFKAQEFGLYLKSLREELGLSLRQVAKRSKDHSRTFSYGYVYRLEKGLIGNPDRDLLALVLEALEVPNSEIPKIYKKYNLI